MIIVFGFAAKVELENAIEWYDNQSPGLGKKFSGAFHETVKRIVLYPEICPALNENVRRAVVKGFPYGIIYAVKTNYIEIVAVANMHRMPMYWNKRIKK